MSILIKGGFLIDPVNEIEALNDILLEGGVITKVAQAGKIKSAEKIIDATGMWVLPGLIDVHVHLREPGFEWKETVLTGVRAAIKGGYTTVCCMPNTRPTNDNAQVTQYILDKAKKANLARVLPIGAVSLGLKGEQLSPMSELWRAGCCAFSDDGEPIYNAGMMRRALEWCHLHSAVICCHEEDKNLSHSAPMNEGPLSLSMGLHGWPAVAEEVMIARDIELARYTNSKVHICHVSTARGAELIRRAKKDGIAVSGEVAPHHLFLTEDAVKGYDTNAKMSPPLRTQADCEALINALADGTIDAIASDHAPHDLDSKEKEFVEAAFGILGLQSSLSLVLELIEMGRLTKTRAVEVMTSGPAKALGLPYGSLSIGACADLVIVDPEAKWRYEKDVIMSISKNSPFIGREMKGVAKTVIVGGDIKMQNGELIEGHEL